MSESYFSFEIIQEEGQWQATVQGYRVMPTHPWINDFASNYRQRSLHLFSKQGDREPWTNPQNHPQDKKMIHDDPIEDDVLQLNH
jgi:hypothetical protein